jgi:NAD(P)-dependent dehydrogenase (short-subunit alcohol dehydrogenase family)
MGKLTNKIALVTGGSSGIGLATAHAFAAEGAQVIITGRNVETLTAATQEIDDGVVPIVADTRELDAIDALFAQIRERFGQLDVLFLNAGIARLGPLSEVSEEQFDEVMDTNFKGLFFTLQRALPLLNAGASVILNGSVNAHVGFPSASVYSASKAAVHSLARTLSAELIAQGIRVNTLNIGPVETPLFSKLGMPAEAVQEFAQAVGGRMPVRRFGKPQEIAQAAVFLASDDSSFVVGSELVTDGGMLINAL